MRAVLVALALLLTGCAGTLHDVTEQGNAVAARAIAAELELADVCRAKELAAVARATSDEEAAALLAPIQAKCSAAFDAYERLQLTWLSFTAALEAEDAPRAAALLMKVIDDERRFAGAVAAVLS